LAALRNAARLPFAGRRQLAKTDGDYTNYHRPRLAPRASNPPLSKTHLRTAHANVYFSAPISRNLGLPESLVYGTLPVLRSDWGSSSCEGGMANVRGTQESDRIASPASAEITFVREQFFLAAAAQNIKRLVRFLSQGQEPTLATT
jgi:hypothetical protein